MRYTTYRYNALTCQYERVKVRARGVVWYCLGLTAMASCLLLGILLLHDLLVNTDTENRLRKENRALRRHHTMLSAGLNELQPVLTALQNKDRILHSKFFGVQPGLPAEDIDLASKEKILLADSRSFRMQVSSLKAVSRQLIERSAKTSDYFGERINMAPDGLQDLDVLPTLQPIIPWQSHWLISGFGLRVNPFHKGLYAHVGVDIALPRGTPVVATGSGTVSQLKRSDLQAGYGNYVEIDHGAGVVTRYAHLEDIHVRYGAKVAKGEIVGLVGTSGGSVAPHLHYEVIRDGKNVDPAAYMIEGLTSDEHHRLTLLSHQQNQSLD